MSSEKQPQPGDIRAAHCNECAGERKHTLLHFDREDWHVEEYDIWGQTDHETLKCCGCDQIKLRRTDRSNDQGWGEGWYEPTVRYYPPTAYRKEPAWLQSFGPSAPQNWHEVRALLGEIYIAVQNQQLRLAAMGVRTLLEQVIIAQIGDQGSFSANLKAFQDAGHIANLQSKSLHKVYGAGSATIHRGWTPNVEDVLLLIDVVESIIHPLYVMNRKVDELGHRVPPRPKPQGSPPPSGGATP